MKTKDRHDGMGVKSEIMHYNYGRTLLRHHLEKALAAFTKIGKKYDILHKTKEEIIEKYGM